MSKKKHPITTTIDIPTEGTLREQFDQYFENHKKVSDIVTFMSIQNARIRAQHFQELNGEKPWSRDFQNEVIDFYEYFMSRFANVTYDAFMDNWGDLPMVLTLAEAFEEDIQIAKEKEELKILDPEVRKEAQELADKIWNTRKDRHLTFLLGDAKSNYFTEEYEIWASEPKESHDYFRTHLLYTCAVMILSHGSLVVRQWDKNETCEVYGVRGGWDNRYVPVSKEEMLDANTLAQDGTRLEPEDGVIYTEITRG